MPRSAHRGLVLAAIRHGEPAGSAGPDRKAQICAFGAPTLTNDPHSRTVPNKDGGYRCQALPWANHSALRENASPLRLPAE
jgi:hypothetical protein